MSPMFDFFRLSFFFLLLSNIARINRVNYGIGRSSRTLVSMKKIYTSLPLVPAILSLGNVLIIN
ncbi:hypothetical protein BY996DRAFT_7098311 [Phakopsora pachyrhizi]|nr:hypothetical protein BY996DRAFT_7098311 [Phakopsora pachyrhizi]